MPGPASAAAVAVLRWSGKRAAASRSDPEKSRPHFARLRELMSEIGERPGFSPLHLSMGMSEDYEVAIEEGATIVRLGRVLFGPRA